MEKSFEDKDYDWDKYYDEVILTEVSLQVFSGDIEHNDCIDNTGLSSLDMCLFRNFEIGTWEELCILKNRVWGKIKDLEGGADLSDYECSKPKGFFLNR